MCVRLPFASAGWASRSAHSGGDPFHDGGGPGDMVVAEAPDGTGPVVLLGREARQLLSDLVTVVEGDGAAVPGHEAEGGLVPRPPGAVLGLRQASSLEEI